MIPVFLALDYPDLDAARAMALATAPHVAGFKVGLELLSVAGPTAIGIIMDTGAPVFADVKLHDIPNTVQGAARALASHGARWVTVHGAGGPQMLQAAVEGLAQGDPGAGALVVTVLTSLDERSMVEIGITDHLEAQVERMTRLAESAGAEGVVCPPTQARVAKTVAPHLIVVTPGIRVDGSHHDQRQVTTPQQALSDGADYLVVGRAVTGAPDPISALLTLSGMDSAG